MQLVGFISLYDRSSQDDPSNKVRQVYLKQQHVRIIIMCALVRSHNDSEVLSVDGPTQPIHSKLLPLFYSLQPPGQPPSPTGQPLGSSVPPEL